ncbi:MAG: VCBS repeat-containing protein, partial [Terracidiphilus sp.]
MLLDVGQSNGRELFRIELHVTAGENNELTFESNETALTLSALDVNQDGAPDIIVEQAFTHKRLQVWLNDGHGLFRKVRSEDFPSAPAPSCQWGSPPHWQTDLTLTLPSKFGSDHDVLIQQVLRFDSSSSNWRDRVDAPFAR